MNTFEWTPTNSAIYDKCQRLATEAGKREWEALGAEGRRKVLRSKTGFMISESARYWVDLWEQYAKGRITEEQVKACFLVYGRE